MDSIKKEEPGEERKIRRWQLQPLTMCHYRA